MQHSSTTEQWIHFKKYIDDGTVKIVSKQQDFESVATPQWSTDEALNRMQNILSSYYADGKNQTI